MRALDGKRCRFPRFVGLAAVSCMTAVLAGCGTDSPSSGDHAHGGSQSGGGNGTGGDGPVGPGNLSTASASVARRLSRAELSNVMGDVLGDDSGAPNKFLNDDVYRPFDNDYTVQAASRALIESLEALADDVAARAVLPENRGKVVPCTPIGPGDAACLKTTIETIGQRLYRRPLSSEQVNAYLTLQSY